MYHQFQNEYSIMLQISIWISYYWYKRQNERTQVHCGRQRKQEHPVASRDDV